MVQLGLELSELDIVGGLDAQDCPAENQQFRNDAHCRAGNLSKRRNEEETHSCYGHTAGEAGHRNNALQFGKLYAFLLIHDST